MAGAAHGALELPDLLAAVKRDRLDTGIFTVSSRRQARSDSFAFQDNPGRDSDRGGAGWDVRQDHRIGADPGVVSHFDASENLRAGADSDVISNNRSNLLIPADSDRHLLIDADIVTNYAAVVQDNAHPVMAEMNVL